MTMVDDTQLFLFTKSHGLDTKHERSSTQEPKKSCSQMQLPSSFQYCIFFSSASLAAESILGPISFLVFLDDGIGVVMSNRLISLFDLEYPTTRDNILLERRACM